jgi:CHAT domain-containing protein/tetratricopeptide (TPR) repeat protein
MQTIPHFAYLNAYGGIALNLPAWLEAIASELNSWRALGPGQRHQTAAARVTVLQHALTRIQDGESRNLPPEVYATLQQELAMAWYEHPLANPAWSLEDALVLCEEALQVYTRDRYPRQYAILQQTLGTAYRDRVKGKRGENIERSLACYRAALAIFTYKDFPSEYARIQQKSAMSYVLRVAGERWENLEQALACCHEALRVHTPECFPYEHALVLYALGNVYWARIKGEVNENREQAITSCQQASQILTLEHFPYDYALCQNTLAIAYSERLAGEKRENIERAIACYDQALRVWTLEAFPYLYARVQNNLGIAYIRRITDDPDDNRERAIACYQRMLYVSTCEDFPYYFALAQSNLSVAYLRRVKGTRREDIELAIAHAYQAQRVWTLDAFPYQYAKVQNNLGELYLGREEGNRSENLELALTFYQSALSLFTHHTFPYECAIAQENIGNAFMKRMAGEREQNVAQALAAFHEALSVFTMNVFPREHRSVQLKCGEAQICRRDWNAAHKAYTAVREVEYLLVALGSGVTGQDAILQEGQAAGANDGFALIRLGRLEEATVVIESGRARGLAAALQLDEADPDQIGDSARRTRYIAARQSFIAAQAALHAPLSATLDEDQRRHMFLESTATYREARTAFDTLVEEIRAARDSADFLHAPPQSLTILKAAEQCGPGHTLVYLAATPWGGFALATCPAHPDLPTRSRFVALDLPALTDVFVNELIETRLDGKVTGGFDCAQQGRGFDLLLDWPGQTLQEKAATLQHACSVKAHLCTLATAAQSILTPPTLADLSIQPVEILNEAQRALIAHLFNREVLRLELARCLPRLRDGVLRPLAAWLCEEGVTSLTLVPCGLLAAFPLAAALIADDSPLPESFSASVAPNARSLLRGQHNSRERSGIYTLGNPYPTQQQLRWGEAEALTLAKLGNQVGLPSSVQVQWEATRAWLLEALSSGCVVDASCHGAFEARDFLRSRLLLAKKEALTLADLLSHQVNLRGLRLIILSACQTALLDLQGARDEVRSLAAGMLQAGAAAALAALWAVDDKATYLLMVRFAQEWFGHMTVEPPAVALARAQRWLRCVTNRELQQWEAAVSVHASSEADSEESAIECVRSAGLRFDAAHAQELVHIKAELQEPDACPYADPSYWIGFQVTGW